MLLERSIPGPRRDARAAGHGAGAERLRWSAPLVPAGRSQPNYCEIVFITVLTLFLTLFFSRLHFRSLINFGIFLTVYNPCHGCHGNRRECAQR